MSGVLPSWSSVPDVRQAASSYSFHFIVGLPSCRSQEFRCLLFFGFGLLCHFDPFSSGDHRTGVFFLFPLPSFSRLGNRAPLSLQLWEEHTGLRSALGSPLRSFRPPFTLSPPHLCRHFVFCRCFVMPSFCVAPHASTT